jgi:hypothetical protein
MRVEPVPFHLPLPGRDTMGFDGIRSVSYRVHGLLHLDGEIATFEWSTTRHSERVSLTGVSVNDIATPPELLDVPVAWIADATLAGGWWRPRLVLRGRRLDAFDGVPGCGLGTVSLRVRWRDRPLAGAMAAALAGAARAWALGDGDSAPQALA